MILKKDWMGTSSDANNENIETKGFFYLPLLVHVVRLWFVTQYLFNDSMELSGFALN